MSFQKPRPRPGFRFKRLVVFVITLSALYFGVAAPQVVDPPWTGSVEVSTNTLRIEPGQTRSYSLWLTEQPTADGWWVRVHVDGMVRVAGSYKGIRWSPSVGWEFDQNNFDEGRQISVTADDAAVVGTEITFGHEVWDHNNGCPVKPEDAPVVTVRIVEDTGTDDGGSNENRGSNENGGNTTNDNENGGNDNENGGNDNENGGNDNENGGNDNENGGNDNENSGNDNENSGKNNENSGKNNRGSDAGARNVERPIDRVNRALLPEIGRALAFTAVRCRIDQAFVEVAKRRAESAGRASLSPVPVSRGWAAADARQLTLEQVLGDLSFLVPPKEGEGGAGRVAVWGCGDYASLAGDGKKRAVDWDGHVSNLQLGADVRFDANVLAGLAVSRSRASFDYRAESSSTDGDGEYDLRLIGVHPYLSWSVSPDLQVWGTVGHSWGEIRLEGDLVDGLVKSDASLASGAVGVSGRLLTRGATTLKLKGEGAVARLDVERAEAAFRKVAADMLRLRLSMEVSHDRSFSLGGTLTPWGELGLRHDGGDGDTGAGVEVGGGMRYRNPVAGWTAEGQGRWLVTHGGALKREGGFRVRMGFDPGAPGLGPSMGLTWTLGEAANGVQRLWEPVATDLTRHDAPASRIDARFAYGIAARRGPGVLTPYGTVSLDHGHVRGYGLGVRLSTGRSVNVSVEAQRREGPKMTVHRFIVGISAAF